jgi:ArsR family transcriptional regulator
MWTFEYTHIHMPNLQCSAPGIEVRPVTRLFKALGDETRLRIVALLAHGELCVCHLETALGLTQPTASRHLAVLRNAGIVDTRRDGSWVYYNLVEQNDPACERLLAALIETFAQREVLRADVERLRKESGPGACR